jgi:glycine C-acetyltransferase/8-amino-7-oxononanoate synthase
VIDIGARLSELEALGLSRKTRLVSGPQGPRVVLNGKPTLSLCSANYLGLADHPSVREAAAEAALRWGAGSGGSRLTSGTMTVHRRLEERLAEFLGRQSALLFGSGFLAQAGVIAALARSGDVVFVDELSHGSILDGCRQAGAETFLYDHLDADHLTWGIRKAEGRAALIATESIFAAGGDLAPLLDIVEVAQRRGVRILVDESHAIGTMGSGGRGALAEAGLQGQVDVILGSLSTALGSYGAFVACDREMALHLLNAASTLMFSSAPAPSAPAAAFAALALLEQRPQLVDRLHAVTAVLRGELARQGFGAGGDAHIVSVLIGAAELSERIASSALEQGILIEAVRPPVIPAPGSFLRLAVMASHRPDELRDAGRILAAAARSQGFDPADSLLTSESVEFEPEEAPLARSGPAPAIFDFEQSERLAA